MKTTLVVAALIEHEGRYLCMQRGLSRYSYTSYRYEFPGGKVEEGETEPEALRRELLEEMNYEVQIVRHLTTIHHVYPDFAVNVSIWLCHADNAEFERREHVAHQWLLPDEMKTVDWVAADREFVKNLKSFL